MDIDMGKVFRNLFIILMSLLLTVACETAPTTVSINLVIDETHVVRTDSENRNAVIGKYLVEVKTDRSIVYSSTIFGSSLSIPNIVVNTPHKVVVTGFNRSGRIVARGESSFTTDRNTSVAVVPEYSIPGYTGELNCTFTVSDNFKLFDSVLLVLNGPESESITLDSYVLDGDNRVYSYKAEKPTGKYSISFALMKGNEEVSPKETVNEYLLAGYPVQVSHAWSRKDIVKLETPVANMKSGVVDYGSMLELEISEIGAEIHYTLDGSIPTSESPVYKSPLRLERSCRILAVATKAGMKDSDPVQLDLQVRLDSPVSNIGNGTYEGTTILELTHELKDVAIHYVIDTKDFLYEKPVEISSNSEVSFYAEREGNVNSQPISVQVMIKGRKPNSNFNSGDVCLDGSSLVLSADDGDQIFYTLDGSIPTASSMLYQSPVLITGRTNLKAIAVRKDRANSDILDLTLYCRTLAPVFTPGEGELDDEVDVVITSASEDSTIYYTLDGSIPMKNNSLIYKGPIHISRDTTIKAFACKENAVDSHTVAAFYDICFGSIGGDIMDPEKYTLNLTSDRKLENGMTLYRNDLLRLEASLEPIPSQSRTEWYLDGNICSGIDGSVLRIGTYGDVAPSVGAHQITVKVVVGDISLTENLVFEIR